jgi:hypothetical protein
MSNGKKVLVAIAALLISAAVVLWLMLPGIVSDKLVAKAAERGVDLQIGDVELGLHNVVLRDSTATLRAVPGLRVSASDVDVEHDWLDVKNVALHGASVELSGDPMDVQREAASASPANDASPRPFVSATGKVVWTNALGTNSKLACDDGSFGLSANGDFTATCASFKVTVGSLVLGPWDLDGSHKAETGDSVNVRFNCAPAGPNASWSRKPTGKVSWTLDIQHATTTSLGIPTSALSLVSLESAPTIQASIGYESQGSVASGHVDLQTDAMPIGKGHAMPASISAKLAGDPAGALRLNEGTATIGKFAGTLTGTITPSQSRADLQFDSAVISCRDAGQELATQSLGQLGQQLGGLFHALGADQGVKGSMTLHADITIDLAHAGATKIVPKTGGDCAFDLFP